MSSTAIVHSHELPRNLLGVMGVLAILGGMLIAFGAVVREGVRLGDASRRANSLLAEASWRCRTLAARSLRDTCLQRYLLERPTTSAGVRALVADAAASTAQSKSRQPASAMP